MTYHSWKLFANYPTFVSVLKPTLNISVKDNSILGKISSILCICVLLMSITPVAFLHNLISDHEDTVVIHNHSHENEFANAGFNCHTDGFVADRNYWISFTRLTFVPPVITSVYQDRLLPDYYAQHHFYAELRGPPSVS